MCTRWFEMHDARLRLRANPKDRNLQKAFKTATKQLKRMRTDGVWRFFEAYGSPLAGCIRENDQFGFCRHLKGMDVKGKRTLNSQYIRDDEGS